MKVACIQITSGADMAANIVKIETLVAGAAGSGAELVALPENAFLMEAPGAARSFYTQREHPGVKAASDMARENACWLLVGSVAIQDSGFGIQDAGKTFNRSLLFNPQGEVTAHYDKIHLFDVELPGGETYAESAKMLPGGKLVVAEVEFCAKPISPSPIRGEDGRGANLAQPAILRPHPNPPPNGEGILKLGMTICYDVRFPHLYRTLAKAGADILAVPSAFTAVTGEAHWHVLLRARAIENGCFVIAPAQTGAHPGGRKTYGHSLIVNPWGEVLADGGTEEGMILADIDIDEVKQVRAKLPSLTHDREFTMKDE